MHKIVNPRKYVSMIAVVALGTITFMTNSTIPVSRAERDVAAPTNPLLEKWTGPNGGVPPFDKVNIADLKPALEAAMTEALGTHWQDD
jgi:peptidyl-dipeptidase Dcp